MIINGIKIELFKLKRTGIYWTLFAVPILFTLVSGVLYVGATKAGYDVLRAVTFQMFLSFIYPLLIGVITALIVRMERKNSGLNNLLISPIPTGQLYLNKMLILALLNLFVVTAIHLVLLFYMLIFDVDGFVFKELLIHFISIWLSGCLISSIQLLFSFKFSGILMPISLCTILTISGLFAITSPKLSIIHLWVYPVMSAFNGYNIPLIIIVSLLLTCLFTLIGVYYFRTKWISEVGKH
ncbi:ABC transporter permease [Priestia sp. FSL R5-0597]|uniref:ABC transporter permease n=1 Tax=Priestia TaxID=2800373 RepID=UPI001649832E|nr:ABC transporter permease [Priestia megaterium]